MVSKKIKFFTKGDGDNKLVQFYHADWTVIQEMLSHFAVLCDEQCWTLKQNISDKFRTEFYFSLPDALEDYVKIKSKWQYWENPL